MTGEFWLIRGGFTKRGKKEDGRRKRILKQEGRCKTEDFFLNHYYLFLNSISYTSQPVSSLVPRNHYILIRIVFFVNTHGRGGYFRTLTIREATEMRILVALTHNVVILPTREFWALILLGST